ncbi:MAG: transglutaminaseTgpA domain-containing protein [Gaiellaceae bacterium]
MSSAAVEGEHTPSTQGRAALSPDSWVARAGIAAALFVVFSILLVVTWTRLGVERPATESILRMVGLAAIPVAAALLLRGRLSPLVWLPAMLAAGVVALAEAFGLSVLDARPGDASRDFFGPLWESFEVGLRGYYETRVTFDPIAHPEMESIVLFAIFGFAAVAGVLAAAGWLVPSGVVLLVGVGWPATLRATVGGNSLAIGALILAALLIVLYAARRRRGSLTGLAQAAVLGGALVLAGVGAASTTLVAKQPALDWQRWTPYEDLRDSVGVRYVWNTSYGGIRWPDDETVVLTVSGITDGSYWRATTLDEYNGFGWLESHEPVPADPGQRRLDVANDPLLPPEAQDEANWVRQRITVGGLADNHLIAAPQPVRWRVGPETPVEIADGGVVFLPGGLEQGQTYSVWSFAPDLSPSDLIEVAADYPAELDRYLEVVPGAGAVPFGTPERAQRMNTFFETRAEEFPLLGQHRPVYEQALNIVGDAPSPYAAAIGLEQWFRNTGGFTYDELPTAPSGEQPPLSEFVLVGKHGYCQHYAGSMALMLRLLGVPSRVAAGFVPGDYNEALDQWRVTDRDAHTWVEVWFPGFGWLPFDPTPGRGELVDTYSTSSADFTLDPEEAGAASDVIAASPDLSALFSGQLAAIGQIPADPGSGAELVTPAAGDSASRGFPLSAVVLLALLGAGVLLVGATLLRRRTRFAGKSGREVATVARRDLEGFLADQGDELGPELTLEALGEHVSRRYGVDAAPFAEAVTLARFGDPTAVPAAADSARREHGRLMRALRERVGPLRRARGALHLGGLRLAYRRHRLARPA